MKNLSKKIVALLLSGALATSAFAVSVADADGLGLRSSLAGIIASTDQSPVPPPETEPTPPETEPLPPETEPLPPETEPTPSQPQKQENVTAKPVGGVTPVVDTTKSGNAVLTEVKKTSKTSVKVPQKVTVDGVSYKVTKIGAGAFSKCTKMTSLTVPATIETIAKDAFKGATKLKKAEIKGKPVVKAGALAGASKLKTLTVTGAATFNKNAFKNTNLSTIKISKKAVFKKGAFKGVDTKKAVIKVTGKVSAKELTKLQNALKAAGFKGKVKKA